MEYYNEEDKTRITELSEKASTLDYSLRLNPSDPLRFDLVSREPAYLDEQDRFRSTFWSLVDLAGFLETEESRSPTQGCWSVEISANSQEQPYESRKFTVIVELSARQEAQAQGLAQRQAVDYIEARPETTPMGATMTAPPQKVSKPSENPHGKTKLGFAVWVFEA
jgi:hypothetical protein